MAIALPLGLMLGCSSGKKGQTSEEEIEVIVTKAGQSGIALELEFRKGPDHNHPLMAIWVEDMDGNFIETLYVASSIGTGIFGHGLVKEGHWEPGPVSRPAALPYWWHKNSYLPTPENPVPDAITGPTPEADFMLESRITSQVPERLKIMLEINQSWDWNEYWTNDKFPDNQDYKTSSQPAIVYEAVIDRQNPGKEYPMKAIGHSHYAGTDGKLYDGLETLTTAKNILGSARVKLLD